MSTLEDFKIQFSEELSSLYSAAEKSILLDIFAQHILETDRLTLRNSANVELLPEQEKKFQKVLAALKKGQPYQQILGKADFFGMTFFINEHVLIPRPETEELLELAVAKIKVQGFNLSDLKILDIGTGSGVIPIVLKKYFPESEITSIDISERALSVAKKNAKIHQTVINFAQKDYLNTEILDKYHVIISNPPYIGRNETEEIAASVQDFEPKIALFSPVEDPLIFYRKIAQDCQKNLQKSGLLFLEINQKLGLETRELFQNFSEKKLIKDLSGNDRFIFAVR